jgi:hypothetical protein
MNIFPLYLLKKPSKKGHAPLISNYGRYVCLKCEKIHSENVFKTLNNLIIYSFMPYLPRQELKMFQNPPDPFSKINSFISDIEIKKSTVSTKNRSFSKNMSVFKSRRGPNV